MRLSKSLVPAITETCTTPNGHYLHTTPAAITSNRMISRNIYLGHVETRDPVIHPAVRLLRSAVDLSHLDSHHTRHSIGKIPGSQFRRLRLV